MKLKDIKIEGEHLVFNFKTGSCYDPKISDTKNHWWIGHMREKKWFTRDVEEMVKRLLLELK